MILNRITEIGGYGFLCDKGVSDPWTRDPLGKRHIRFPTVDLFVRPESGGGKATETGCGGIEILSANIPVGGGKATDAGCGGIEILSANIPVGEGKATDTGCGGIEILSANIPVSEGKITDTDCGDLSVGITSPEDHGHD